tara:strand:- start:21153 stop:21767 length:615 start_codon:yes stop_codon:yes gene_type:complete
MAIFRPQGSSSTGNNFYGICEIAVLGIEDKSSNYEWADIYLDIEIKQKGSDYTKKLRIAGDLEKDHNGNISGGSVLKRMYNFFDIIGEKAGLTIEGKWEDETGAPIGNIATYLNQRHVAPVMPDSDPNFDYLAYVYKEKPKEKGGKVYSRVFHRVQRNDDTGRKKLESDVQWFKNKGFIKEATEEDTSTPKQNVEMSSEGIGNL